MILHKEGDAGTRTHLTYLPHSCQYRDWFEEGVEPEFQEAEDDTIREESDGTDTRTHEAGVSHGGIGSATLKECLDRINQHGIDAPTMITANLYFMSCIFPLQLSLQWKFVDLHAALGHRVGRQLGQRGFLVFPSLPAWWTVELESAWSALHAHWLLDHVLAKW